MILSALRQLPPCRACALLKFRGDLYAVGTGTDEEVVAWPKPSTGEFDWVLSRIEQDEVYEAAA
jgi:hypothetical protein